ncbi:MAG: hypothetical protein GX167_07885 [Firmicutes bacterium]|nr:hypothetical protein [Bacillota bacterium]
MTGKRVVCVAMLLLFLLSLALFTGCTQSPNEPRGNNQEEPPQDEVTLTGAELVETRCAQCHSLDRVSREREDQDWLEHTERMRAKSPDLLTDEEAKLVLEYLQETY